MRVISGIARGKKLFSPTTEATQPTMDRAKETLFNMLESWRLKEGKGWGQISFLDVFAGSGAIGIEAWSRGVKSPYFMENDVDALKILNQNLALVKLPKVGAVDALNPSPAPRAMSVVFMDAPYNKGLTEKALSSIVSLLNKGALCLIEMEKNENLEFPKYYNILDERRYGIAKIVIAEFIC